MKRALTALVIIAGVAFRMWTTNTGYAWLNAERAAAPPPQHAPEPSVPASGAIAVPPEPPAPPMAPPRPVPPDVLALVHDVPPPSTATAIVDALARGDFAAAEAKLAWTRALGPYPGDHETPYEVLRVLILLDLRYHRLADRWCEVRPRSALAFLLRGELELLRAHYGRREAPRPLSAALIRGFGETTGRAKADLERSHELDPAEPEAAAALIRVAAERSADADEARRWFDAALAARKRTFVAFAAMHDYLLPSAQGSEPAMRGFVRESIAARPDHPALFHLVLESHIEIASAAESPTAVLDRPEVRAEVESAIEKLLAAYPRNQWVCRQAARLAELRGDRAGRLAWLRRGVEAGDPRAAMKLGGWFLGANGEPDPPEALRFLGLAARLGHPRALTVIGGCHETGFGVPRDRDRAGAWYRAAAAAGDEMANGALARLAEPDASELAVYGDEITVLDPAVDARPPDEFIKKSSLPASSKRTASRPPRR